VPDFSGLTAPLGFRSVYLSSAQRGAVAGKDFRQPGNPE
jgi:hypothetical protein